MRLDDLPDEVEFPYEDDDILGDDELPSDGYDLYKNYMQDQIDRLNMEVDIENLQDEVDRLQRLVDNPTYSHRNGETTPPMVAGWYWIIGDKDNNYPVPNEHPPYICEYVWTSQPNEHGIGLLPVIGDYHHVVLLGANYYGPIPMPTRKEIPHG